jgi:predicted transcriptional regulator
MPPKSKVEKSPHFNEILDMIREGLSPRTISDHLKNEFNESISHTAINNYIKKIRSKTNQEYYKKKKQKEEKLDEVIDSEVANKEAVDEVIQKGVDDLNVLDSIIELGEKLDLDVSKIKPQFGPQGGVIVSQLDVFYANIAAAKLVLKAVDSKSIKLKDEPDPPTVNVFNNDLNSFFKEQREIAIKKTAEKDDSQ